MGLQAATVRVRGVVTVEHRNAAGKLIRKETVKNTVLNGGLEWLKGQFGDSGTDRAKYIGLSSGVGAPAAGDSDLGATVYTAFGLERAAGTYASGATGVCTFVKVFTNDTAQHTVASTGLYYKASGAGMFSGVAITSATLEVGDTLTITWTVTFS